MRTKTHFLRLVRAATKAAGYGRGFKKELTLWTPRSEWPSPESPEDGVMNEGADMLGFSPDEVYERWDGRQVIEVYISIRSGRDWELYDNVEIDPVGMEWSSTGQPWRTLEVDS